MLSVFFFLSRYIDHFPFISDEACVGSIAALFVIEVIVAAISVGIIIVVLWRWCSQCGTADDTKEACELEDTKFVDHMHAMLVLILRAMDLYRL